MRPTSIIFLCLSVILIVGGIVTCYIATGMAAEEGIELFEEAGGERDYEQIPLDEISLNKISLVLKNADVNIYGGAEESFIELLNYGGSYSYGVSSGILTLDESTGFLKLLDFGETKLKFGGLRQYLFRKNSEVGKKVVNLYFTNDYQLKQLEVKLGSGDITVRDLRVRADLSFKLEHGNLLLEHNRNNSAVSVELGNGNAVIRDTTLVNLEGNIKRGDLSYYAQNYSFQTYELSAGGGGEVFVQGVSKGDTYTASTPMASIKINVTTKDVTFISAKLTRTRQKNEPEETTANPAVPAES